MALQLDLADRHPERRNALAMLRANLSLSSIAFRHAVRCGVCLAVAVVGERTLAIPHGYWIPMTTAIVLKPDFAGTFSFGLLRVVGTMLGLVLTTALVHYAFGSPWERLALLSGLSIGFRLLTTVHYGIGVALRTGLVVILLSFDGVPPADTMLAQLSETYPNIVAIASAAAHDADSLVGPGCDDQFEFEFALDLLLEGFDRLHRRGWSSTR